jgi:hypothetical protein
MSDPNPSPSPEKNIIVAPVNIGRLWTLTIISLTLNVVILILLMLGAIAHHREMMRERFEGRHMDGGGFGDRDRGGRPFHRFDGGWRQGPPGDRGPSGDRVRGPGGPPLGSRGLPEMMNDDPAKMTDAVMNHLSQTLALTDDEKAKIKPIVEQQVQDMQKQRDAQRAAMQKQIEDAKAKIKPLLTPDQQKQLDAMPLPGQKPPGDNGEP